MNTTAERPYIEVATVGDLLVRAAMRDPDTDALVLGKERVTYGELLHRASNTARGLVSMGVGRGDQVGILMGNCIEFVQVLFATALIGAVAVPVNARFRTRELEFVVPHARLKVLFTAETGNDEVDHPGRILEAFPQLVDAEDAARQKLQSAPDLTAVVLLSDKQRSGFVSREAFERRADTASEREVERLRALVRIRDVAAILYTSGTTANPKGCLHTHEALVRNSMVTGRSRFLLTSEDGFWDPLPLFHVAALIPLMATIDAGGTFLSMTHFESRAALDQIVDERATWLFPAFPAITAGLMDDPTFGDRDLSSVRMTMSIGPEPFRRRFQRAIPHAVQISTYGSTETGGVITYHLATDSPDQRATTCGPPFRGIELAIRDLDSQAAAPLGTTGEILVRGYSVTDGYYRDPEATAEAIDADGWLRTGDLGTLDENGHVTYVGRLKDMLKVGGENVAALEIESLLMEHPDIVTAQVVAAPNDKLDEVPAAFIELRPSADVGEDDIIEFCRGRLASFKVPRHVRFVTEWPMSATKIQKWQLRERIAKEVEA